MSADTLPALLAARRADAANTAALIDDRERLTYRELDERSAALASHLLSLGINKGERTALLMPNCASWVVIACAIMRVGAVLVPLSTLLRPRELQQQLATAGVRHLISVDSHRGRDYRSDLAEIDRSTLPSLRNVWWSTELESIRESAVDLSRVRALEARVRAADELVALFTSGSQGSPKGVIHTHGNALRATRAGLDIRCIDSQTRMYISMPFFWTGGFGAGVLSTLIAGATLLTERSPEPSSTLKFLAREQVTLFRGWPDQALQLARHPEFAATDLSSLKVGSLEGVLPAAKRSEPGRRAKLYGMTESFGPCAGYWLDRDMPATGWNSCGQPLQGISLRIVNPQTGALLAPGEVGAIQLSGSHLMSGICGREREQVFTADGWYDTGDLGHLNDAGFLFFAGRRDDMFKVKGATVYPAEVEEALLTIPGVRRAFAIDIEIDGATAVGAAILLEQSSPLDVAGLTQAARTRLSAFKLPTRWTIVNSLDALPMLASGKIDKKGLRAFIARS